MVMLERAALRREDARTRSATAAARRLPFWFEADPSALRSSPAAAVAGRR